MKIQILFFGIGKDIVGRNLLEMEVPDGSSVLDLKNQLINKYPAFKDLKSLAIAVNSEYRLDGFTLSGNDEIAIIPPVCGG